ncbi:MAG: restriction endonuclease subunit S [Lachnospiraceae bacterium]|nr:restriction endonuclease subunit S [Butyrivibrio sp.]MBQ6967210.1 restriction endonuclease subunit S [Lachnospiraceae bacterium]
MARQNKNENLTIEEKLEKALVPEGEQPYEVPGNWCWVKIGEITNVVSGGTPSTSHKEYYENGDIAWISPADLSNYHDKFISKGAKNITKLGLEKSSARIMPENTVCLSTRAPIGYVVIAMNELCTNQGFKSFLPSRAYIPDYLYWYLKGIKERLEEKASGTTFLELSGTKASQIEFPIAPLPEQHRIVKRIESLFSQLDEARDKAQEALDNIQDTWSSISYDAFSGKLTAEWRKTNNKAETWTEYSLQDVCSMKITDGTHQTPTYCKKEDGGIPFISAKDVTSKKISWDEIKYIVPELHNELYARIAPQIDDILLAKNGTTGVAAIVETDKVFDIYVTLAVLRPNKEIILPRYLLNIVNSPVCKDQFNEHLTGIGVPNLHLRDIKAVMIRVPEIDEQKEVVRIIDNFWNVQESVIEATKSVIENIELTKKSILSKAFRGELGTNDPEEESAVELIKSILEAEEYPFLF